MEVISKASLLNIRSCLGSINEQAREDHAVAEEAEADEEHVRLVANSVNLTSGIGGGEGEFAPLFE